MSDPFVSIIVRSLNEAWALRETLPALKAQDYTNWELIVIDSGSTDGSVELIHSARPTHFIQIPLGTYNPSRVMNQGMQLARSQFGIFLNADATPQNGAWLRPLVMALQDPGTAAVFGRQVPRPDCRAVYAHDYERCFGPNRESSRWDHFFSMVSSGLRKDIWARRGFLETMQYSEDDEYTRWCRKKGYRIVFCPESVVVHSHNYSLRQAYRRSFGEARARAAVWKGSPTQINWPRTVLLGCLNDLRRDFHFCARQRRLHEWCHAVPVRWQQRRAKLAGFKEGWKFYRQQPTRDRKRGSNARFTLDGSAALEEHLNRVCDRILSEIQNLVPREKLKALVLGGGYGRGEGGVLLTTAGDRPYNDLEFYVFLNGNRLWNERRYGKPLLELARRLSPEAGLHVEFKIDSSLRRRPVSIFSYDLVSAHRLIFGDASLFDGCEHHLDPSAIPLSESSRLLFNRCSGLLLAGELLRARTLTVEEADFVGRNLAKAQLCLGDALLAACGRYHWSCRQRSRSLNELCVDSLPAGLEEIRRDHRQGLEFKLHPSQAAKSVSEFEAERTRLCALAGELWLWLENRRLGLNLKSVREYAFHPQSKYPDLMIWRNYLLNVRTFGAGAALQRLAWRYPRERLLNSLALLLWNKESTKEPELIRHLQKQLSTRAADWGSFVTAYKEIWPRYG